MDLAEVVERVRHIAGVRADGVAPRVDVELGLVHVRRVRGWLDASEAEFAARLAATDAFAENTLAGLSRGSLASAGRTLERSATLGAVPGLADALNDGDITAGHIDAVTRAAKSLEGAQREVLFDRIGELADAARDTSEEAFARRVRDEARRIQTDDGVDRFERQRRATSLKSWVDDEGMWNLRGRFDPLSGVKMSARLDEMVEALFAQTTPATCPSDPVERQHHLRALALLALVAPDRTQTADSGAAASGTAPPVSGVGRSGRPEFVVVINADNPVSANGVPDVEWSIPVEVPWPVLVTLARGGEVHPVVVRNGIVVHAPGHVDLGRSTRLANRAQRRALRALYSTCGVDGCSTHFDKCHVHHVVWWEHGGTTDLHNLIPLCNHHHHCVHNQGWTLTLGPNRQLTITLPDGTIHATGPPTRHAA